MSRPRKTEEEKKIMKEKGRSLSAWRKAHSLTQADLAKIINKSLSTNLSSQSIARYEQGRSQIPSKVSIFLQNYDKKDVDKSATLYTDTTYPYYSIDKRIDAKKQEIDQIADKIMGTSREESLNESADLLLKAYACLFYVASKEISQGENHTKIEKDCMSVAKAFVDHVNGSKEETTYHGAESEGGKKLNRNVIAEEGQELRKWRKALKLSQAQLADKINDELDTNSHLSSQRKVEAQTISRYETGTTKIPTDVRACLIRISEKAHIHSPKIGYDAVADLEVAQVKKTGDDILQKIKNKVNNIK